MDKQEKAAIISLKSGDFESFDQLFNKYGKRLYGFAIGYLKSKEDAEGLVQDIFVKVWENRAELDENQSFNSYLFAIAKNRILNHFRKKAHQQSYIEYIKQHTKLIHAKTEEDIIYSDLYDQTKKVIDQLPSRRREIFLLSREQGYNNEEIAQRFNISKKTVENQITHALKFIREQLGKKNLIPLLFISLFL